MDKEFTKIPENAESKAIDREKEKYPVQQIATEVHTTEKEVECAVEELNPDKNSLESR